jgi:LssY C-terminus
MRRTPWRCSMSAIFLLILALAFAQFQVPQGTLQPAQQNVQSTQAPVSSTSAPATENRVANSKRKLDSTVKVSAQQPWTDSGIDLIAGDHVTVTSTGQLNYMENSAVGPRGITRTWKDTLRALPVNDAGRGALIARIGNDPNVVPFLIGDQKTFDANRSGRLFLGINQASNESGNGQFNATVKIVPAKAVASSQSASKPLSVPADLFDKIPRRVNDEGGNKGDMVNFLIIGPEDKMKELFQQGGWVLVDKTKQDAILHAALSTLSNKTYTEMPMSELSLFGRSQDFGFARAEPVQVVESRNHLRVWKAPFDFDGQPVWVGAATHDIGFEKDQRNGKVTHKIDPNVDLEREFVGSTLGETGLVAGTTYVLPNDPVQTAMTATGGSFHSDGRVLVMKLK